MCRAEHFFLLLKPVETIRSFRWKIGHVLPHEIQEKLDFSEKEYLRSHSSAIKTLVPPKDPYIQLQVLEDIGSGRVSRVRITSDVKIEKTFLPNLSPISNHPSKISIDSLSPPSCHHPLSAGDHHQEATPAAINDGGTSSTLPHVSRLSTDNSQLPTD
ncbi:hypothetical protein ZWY2020_019330 [Hordeum vulgare]|nr:hypothetical protein ZWY2020_019330 [Hordeum vulgare]